MRPVDAVAAWLSLPSKHDAKIEQLRKPRKPSIHAALRRFLPSIYPLDFLKTLNIELLHLDSVDAHEVSVSMPGLIKIFLDRPSRHSNGPNIG